jgi:hypothetical protein
MTIGSPAVLLVQNDVVPGREAGFDAWYLADHMPDRVGVPGFRRARRWHAVSGGPRDLSLYELDGTAVMTSAPYLARLAAPTEGTRRFMDAFVGMLRSVCIVEQASGFADGGWAALLPVVPGGGAEGPDLGSVLDACRPEPESGVVASALLRCDDEVSRSDSVESRLRAGADGRIAAAIWIEAVSAAQAEAALHAARGALHRLGVATGQSVILHLVAAFRSHA